MRVTHNESEIVRLSMFALNFSTVGGLNDRSSSKVIEFNWRKTDVEVKIPSRLHSISFIFLFSFLLILFISSLLTVLFPFLYFYLLLQLAIKQVRSSCSKQLKLIYFYIAIHPYLNWNNFVQLYHCELTDNFLLI